MSVAIDRPFPTIRIVDVSPYRSSLRSRPTAGAATRRMRRRIGAALLAVLAAVALASVAGAAPTASDAAGDFRLGPGHTMPTALDRGDEPARRGPAMTGFRLAPGNQLPVSLAD